ncbi:MAG TPA: argininosuccinate lyase [Bdellovibrionota bacterium]|jgi:argininosuccinate lyase
MAKLWGGRFEKETHPEVEAFSNSLALDSRLCASDLTGSIAHAEMLAEQGILSAEEGKTITNGLRGMLEEQKAGKLSLSPSAEDIHSAIESELTKRIGAVAGKLHTARSRNDQVATACRIYMIEQTRELQCELAGLQSQLLKQAESHFTTVLPGFTHLQHAQPVSLAHHLLAYFWMFQRDRERLRDMMPRLSSLPLGSAALAGTTLPTKRESVQKKLGFASLCENSLDAVSDRDFQVEFLSAAALIGSHLSRICEELILWSTPEFGFVQMADEVTTGSSLMPQKKNPDVAELIRGKTGRLTGSLMGALTLLKGLPLSYNRDLQEDKFHLFTGLDTARACVRLATVMLEACAWNAKRMKAACEGDQSNATDLADYLVKKGMPFRETHEVAGKAVRIALEKGIGIEKLPLAELKKLSGLFEQDVYALLDPQVVMSTRNSRGGTGVEAVKQQFGFAKTAREKAKEWK